MLSLSIPVFMTVTIPETILNIFIVLLFSNNPDKLNFKTGFNKITFATTVAFLASSSILCRMVSPNIAVNMLLHALIYIAVLMVIYRISFYHAVFSVSMLTFLLVTIENTYIPIASTYISGGIEGFLGNTAAVFISSIPVRLIQFFVIKYMYKHNPILLFGDINISIRLWFSVTLLTLSFASAVVSFGFAWHFQSMSHYQRIIFFLGLVAVQSVNYFIIKLLKENSQWIFASNAIKHSELEDSIECILGEINRLLDKNDIAEIKGMMAKLGIPDSQ